MTRVVGNSDLENEQIYAFEIGYLGRFLDNRLTVALNLYYNLYMNEIVTDSNIVVTPQGLPDLNASSYMFDNMEQDTVILGGELTLSYKASKWLTLQASWSHREAYEPDSGFYRDSDPKNLITLGGRLRTESGLLGSLYVFTRSEFWDRWVYNPDGMLEDILHQHLDNVALVLGKLGWRFRTALGVELEAGVKLFLPVSPFSSPHFNYRDKGGGLTHSGGGYGGNLLGRMVTGYLEGTF
jgi:outer membrane receptor protein involved in Fe transport